MSFKTFFLILSSGGLFIQQRRTVCAILIEVIIRKYFKFGPVVQEEMPFKDTSYLIFW